MPQLVRQTELADEPLLAAHGLVDERRVEVGQPQLRSPEHVEAVVVRQRARAEPERPLATRPVDERPAEVEPAVVGALDRDLERPADRLRISGPELDGLAPAREADVDVLVHPPVEAWPTGDAGEVGPTDLDGYARTVLRAICGGGRPCRRGLGRRERRQDRLDLVALEARVTTTALA